MFFVWAIEDICTEDSFENHLSVIAVFSNIENAKHYQDLLDGLDAETRFDSRDPDWGFHFFIQEQGNPCYVIHETGSDDDDLRFIFHSKQECVREISRQQKIYKCNNYATKEIGPYDPLTHSWQTDKDIFLDMEGENLDDLREIKKYRRTHALCWCKRCFKRINKKKQK